MSPSFRFSIGATFTAEPLAAVIHFWGRQLNQDFEIRFAPYNQVEQTLLDARGEFAANTHGVNAIAIRLEDFGGLDLARIRRNTHHFLQALRQAHQSLASPSILCLCPESRTFLADDGRSRAARELRDQIAATVAALPGVHFLETESLYPLEDYEAPGGGELGHIPYSEIYYAALGSALVRRAHALTRRPYKVIALDCDDTLWKGLCGEDGPGGITLDAPRLALQQFMLQQREAGMLLTMASKNNETDVLAAFKDNPHMPLQPGHFAAWRINWESKAANLAELAKELNVGLDSFIFVDDNPKECAEVESSVPEVLTIPLPAELSETDHFLRHVWAFDPGVVTAADRKRSEYYAQSRQFGAGVRSASNLQEFLAGLNLSVRIAPLAAVELPRVAQLTQRTNQFNFTTISRSESAIQPMLDNGYECLTVHVSDRFGDYGLTGAVLLAALDGELIIDTFLLSCRVLGRGVEHRVMAFLAEYAAERGLGVIVAELDRTPKNAPAQQFLDSIGAADEDFTYRLPVESLRGLAWKPEAAPRSQAPSNSPRSSAAQHSAPEYARIARTLSTPARILAEMRRSKRCAMSVTTETEQRLAEIWADLLHAPSISASDNFFDLGGHSLLAVLLLVRIKETFGIELSIDDVYSGALTLAELAQRIDSPDYAELLREIEALSDEEARDLLAEGDAGHANPADL